MDMLPIDKLLNYVLQKDPMDDLIVSEDGIRRVCVPLQPRNSPSAGAGL